MPPQTRPAASGQALTFWCGVVPAISISSRLACACTRSGQAGAYARASADDCRLSPQKDARRANARRKLGNRFPEGQMGSENCFPECMHRFPGSWEARAASQQGAHSYKLFCCNLTTWSSL